MNHAVQLMAQHPALKYGSIFEIRPAADLNEMMKASELRQGNEAAREFQKFLDHRTIVANCFLAPLAPFFSSRRVQDPRPPQCPTD